VSSKKKYSIAHSPVHHVSILPLCTLDLRRKLAGVCMGQTSVVLLISARWLVEKAVCSLPMKRLAGEIVSEMTCDMLFSRQCHLPYLRNCWIFYNASARADHPWCCKLTDEKLASQVWHSSRSDPFRHDQNGIEVIVTWW